MDKNIGINKTETKKILKRKALIKAGAKVFSQKGFMNTAIKDITEEANVAVGTFYSYFKSKEEVLEQIYDDIFEESREKAERNLASVRKAGSISEKFVIALTGAVLSYADNKEAAEIVFSKGTGISSSSDKKRQQLIDRTVLHLEGVIKHLKEEHNVIIDNTKMCSVMMTYSIYGILSFWISNRYSGSLEDMIFSLCEYSMNALNIEFDIEEVQKWIREAVCRNKE